MKKLLLALLIFWIAGKLDQLGQCAYWTVFFARQGYDTVGTAKNCIAALIGVGD